MKRLGPNRKGQQVWEYKGRKYSIVDMTVWPGKFPLKDETVKEWKELTSFYKPYQFELARVSKGEIKVLGRFQSFKQAQEHIVARSAHFSELAKKSHANKDRKKPFSDPEFAKKARSKVKKEAK